MANLGLEEKPAAVPLMQACAAVGQSVLMHTYEQLFFGKKVVAQLLLSSDDFTSPIRYRNLQNTLHELLKLGVVPIVNENDSVSVRELVGAFGDNDELSALLAKAVKADWLLLLTDVDGFFVPNGKHPHCCGRSASSLPTWKHLCNGNSKLGTRRHALETTRRQARQRVRRTRRHRERAPPSRHSLGDGTQDWDLLSAAAWEVLTWRQPTTAASTRDKLLRARQAASLLAQLSTAQKNALLLVMADVIEANAGSILEANQRDLESSGLEGAMRERLLLNPGRITSMAQGMRDVAHLPDPVNETLAEWARPNGLRIRKLRVPLGVIGIIYESRPNVTVDTVALALKTGNAIVLRGGKEAASSNQRLVEILSEVSGLPQGAIELLDSSSRDSVHELVKARGLVDVIIPRGRSATDFVCGRELSRAGHRDRRRELSHLCR